MLGLLAAGGYPHWISVEWEKRWHPEIEAPEVALPQHLDLLATWLESGQMSGFGIVGTGVIAAMHAAAIATLPGARLAAVTDVAAEAASAFAAARGCAAEPSLDALLARPDVDVVCVCVPSGQHAEVGVRAARAGKHLVVEKPIDVTLAAADRLIEAARAAGVALTVISQHRFDPGLIELKRLLGDGALGRLVLAEASTKWYRTQGYYDSAAWRGTWAMDGGSLMNQGVHYVDLLRWCMGPVTEVTAVCATQAHQVEVEDTALAIVRFGSGAVGTILSSTAAFPGFPQRLEVTGTDGTVIVEDGRIVRRAFGAQAGTRRPGRGPGDGAGPGAIGAAADPAAIDVASHAAQIADLLAAIEEGREPAVDGQAGRDALEIVCAVYESARTGRAVLLPGGRPPMTPPIMGGCPPPIPPDPRDRHAQRVRRRDLARPARTARHARRRVDHAPGAAQRLVGQRGRPHRPAARRVPGHAGRRRGPGLRDRLAHREDPGRRAARSRAGPDAPYRGHGPRARHHDRPRVLVLHPARGAAGAAPGAGHRPDGRAGRDRRRAGPGAGPREREGDLRGHSRTAAPT